MGRSASSCGCPKHLQCVPRSHFPDAAFGAPCLPTLGILQLQRGHLQRKRPVAQFTHVLVLNEADVGVRPLQCGTAVVVMAMFTVVGVVRAARHHVPDLMHEFQPRQQRPCGQQRERRKASHGGDVLGSNHDGFKISVGGRDLVRVEAELWNFKARQASQCQSQAQTTK